MKKITENPEKIEESTFNKVQDRRTFFLSISKAVLPGLALLGLGMVTLSGCEKCDGCEATCADDCTIDCSTVCAENCDYYCQDSCKESCTGSCTTGCFGNCTGGCYTGCTGGCGGACSHNCSGGCGAILMWQP